MTNSAQQLGKVPPSNLEAEESVLGSMMIESSACSAALALLKAEDFYRPVNQDIFNALAAMSKRNEPADLITFQEELRKAGKLEDCGGTEYLMALLDAVPTAANVEHYAKIVLEKSKQRRLLAFSDEIKGQVYNADEGTTADAIIDKANKKLVDMSESRLSLIKPVKDVVDSWWSDIDQLYNGTGELPWSAPYRIGKWNTITHGGVRRGEVHLVVSGSGEGKTATELNVVDMACKEMTPVLFFTCEMTDKEVIQRLVCCRAEVDSYDIYNQRANLDRLANGAGEVYNYPLWVNEIPPTVSEFESMTKAWCAKNAPHGNALIVVDYSQLLASDNPRDDEITRMNNIMRSFKNTAKVCGIGLLSACQLRKTPAMARRIAKPDEPNRDADGYPAFPTKDDILGARAIDAFGDAIWVIVRPDDEPIDGNGRQLAYWKNLKYRHGQDHQRGKLWFTGKYTRFDDCEDRYEERFIDTYQPPTEPLVDKQERGEQYGWNS